MRGAALLVVIGIYVVGGCRSVHTIEQHGAAVSEPMPGVTVFVPQSYGREKEFGDYQLRAIVPAMKWLHGFDALNLNGSSVTGAGLGCLKALTKLERLEVCNTAITVDGLMALRGLPKLRLIVVARGQYSDEEVARLRREFSKATVLEWGRVTSVTTGVDETE